MAKVRRFLTSRTKAGSPVCAGVVEVGSIGEGQADMRQGAILSYSLSLTVLQFNAGFFGQPVQLGPYVGLT